MGKKSRYHEMVEELHMEEEQKNQLREILKKNMSTENVVGKNRFSYRSVLAAVGFTIAIIGGFVLLVSQPAIAKKIPILNSIFAMVEEQSLLCPGKYSEKSQKVDSKNSNTEGIYKASANQIEIEASEIYSDGSSVYMSARIKKENGDFGQLEKYGMSEKKSENLITIKGYTQVEGCEEKCEFTGYDFEGKNVNDNTFAGMVKFNIFHDELTEGILNIDIYQIVYQVNPTGEWGGSKDVYVDGSWKLKIPFKVDTDSVKKYHVSKSTKDCEIDHVSVSDEQIAVYSKKNYGIQAFDQDGKEIQSYHSGTDADRYMITFPLDKQTRRNLSKINIYAFSRTEDGLDRAMMSMFDSGKETVAKKLSDLSVVIDIEK